MPSPKIIEHSVINAAYTIHIFSPGGAFAPLFSPPVGYGVGYDEPLSAVYDIVVGDADGFAVGDTDGFAVGDSVGNTDGFAVGDTDGFAVGDLVGASVSGT